MAATKAAMTKCGDCPLRKRDVFRNFTAEEFEFIKKFKTGELGIAAGATLYSEGSDSAHLYTILSGWAFRYKLVDDGGRQILNFALPGDLLGLQSALLGSLEHSVEALSDLKLCVFERERMFDLFAAHPGLAFDVTWLGSHEERLLDENLVNMGRRSAAERIAYLLLLLLDRERLSGQGTRNRLRVPLTQYHLADMLGLSLVHTNKTLRGLVKEGFLSWKPSAIEVLKRDELAAFARYERVQERPRPFL